MMSARAGTSSSRFLQGFIRLLLPETLCLGIAREAASRIAVLHFKPFCFRVARVCAVLGKEPADSFADGRVGADPYPAGNKGHALLRIIIRDEAALHHLGDERGCVNVLRIRHRPGGERVDPE